MNKIIFAFFALSLLLVGCSKDDNDTSGTDIVGKWVLLEAMEDGEDAIQEWYGTGSHITFHENKTFTHFWTKNNYSWKGAWQFDNGDLIIAEKIYPAGDTYVYVDGFCAEVKSNGNIMELTSTYEVTDGISTHTETIYWKLQRSE